MKTIFLTFTLSIFSILASAQNSNLVGPWLLTKVEVGDDIHEPYYVTDFRSDGKMIVMDMEAGTWKVVGKTIEMKSDMDKDFDGISAIVKLTKKELIVTKNEAKLFYSKVNPSEIIEANSASGLIGLWKISNTDDATQLLKFESPNTYSYINATEGMTEKGIGTWIYNSKDQSLIIIGNTYSIRGKNKIINHTENELTFDNNGTITSATKEIFDGNVIERLTFTDSDIPEEPTGEFNLPWFDHFTMIEYLQHVSYLKFRNGSLIEELNTLKYLTTVSELEVNIEEQSVSFHNLSISESDTTQFSENYKGGMMESGNLFFPKKEPWPYKIVGLETITVPAGTFECTVVIALDYDKKYKYWMINDKPGVYAKTIMEGVSVFDELEYTVIELEEIQ